MVGDVAIAAGVADGAGGRPRGRASWVRRLLVGGAWTVAAGAAFAVYLRLAGTRAVNSDGASTALAAWDMLHGNVLLRGWSLPDANFSSTEIPQYALVELTVGLGQNVVHIAAAMTYTLALLLVALVAKAAATGREAAARIAIGVGIMLAPQLGSGTNVLLSSPDHFGTSVPLLLILLIIDRVRRPRWWAPVAVSLLLAWAQTGGLGRAAGGRDPARRRVRVPGGAVAAAARGPLVRDRAGGRGGGRVRPRADRLPGHPRGRRLHRAAARHPAAPLGEIFAHNLPIAAQCLLLLPAADFLGLPAGRSSSRCTWSGSRRRRSRSGSRSGGSAAGIRTRSGG